jgi:DUF4097 and DUF4098 domain-containing protein YvlB
MHVSYTYQVNLPLITESVNYDTKVFKNAVNDIIYDTTTLLINASQFKIHKLYKDMCNVCLGLSHVE